MFASKSAAQPSFAAGDEYLAQRESAAGNGDAEPQIATKENGDIATSPAETTPSQSEPQEPQAAEADAASPAANADELSAAGDQTGTPPADDNAGQHEPAPSGQTPPANSPVFTLGDAATNAVIADTAAPDLPLQNAVVSHHRPPRASWWSVFGVVVLLLLLAVVALDILLDTGVIKTNLHVPHTHFFGVV